MYEYKYVSVDREGLILAKFEGYREIINREAAQGWRYAGWLPGEVTSSTLTQIDLVFEREV